MPDKDNAGEDYMRDVYGALIVLPEPPSIKVLRLEGLPDKGDIVDWVKSFISEWDGYTPIAENLHTPLKQELRTELKKGYVCINS